MIKIWMVLAVAPAILLGQSVTGIGNFAHVVENLDKSLEFYKAALGLEVATPAGPFTGNPALMKLGDTAGAQARFAILRVPGVPAGSMGVELIEYKDIDRKPAHPRFQYPGAVNLSLRLKDFDGVVARVKEAGAHIMTLGGEPVTIRGTHSFFVQDPDGFIFEATVNNLEETVTAYRALGLMPTAPNAWNGDKTMTDNAGTPGAQFRQSRAPIPTPVGAAAASIAFIEFKDIDRNPLHTRLQDPGSAFLQLYVTGLDAMTPKLKAAGFATVTIGGEPVDMGGARFLQVRDANNLSLQLVERKTQ